MEDQSQAVDESASFEDETHDEADAESTTQGSQESPDIGKAMQAINELREQVGTLVGSQSNFANQVSQLLAAQQAAAKPKAQEVSDEQIANMWAENPAKATELMVQRSIGIKASELENKTKAQMQKQFWDTKAQSDFPTSDPEFQKELKSEWTRRVADGRINPDSVTAVYDVAEVVNYRLGSRKAATKSVSAPSGEAPRASVPKESKGLISDDHPSVRIYKTYNPKATKEQLKKYKADLARRLK